MNERSDRVAAHPAGLHGDGRGAGVEDLEVGVAKVGVVGHVELGHGEHQRGPGHRSMLSADRTTVDRPGGGGAELDHPGLGRGPEATPRCGGTPARRARRARRRPTRCTTTTGSATTALRATRTTTTSARTRRGGRRRRRAPGPGCRAASGASVRHRRAAHTASASSGAGRRPSRSTDARCAVTTSARRGAEASARAAGPVEGVATASAPGPRCGPRTASRSKRVDAAVAPHLLGLGGHRGGGEALPRLGPAPHQPVGAAQRRRRVGGEGGQGSLPLSSPGHPAGLRPDRQPRATPRSRS